MTSPSRPRLVLERDNPRRRLLLKEKHRHLAQAAYWGLVIGLSIIAILVVRR